MKIDALPQKVTVVTLQTVLDHLSADPRQLGDEALDDAVIDGRRHDSAQARPAGQT